MKHFEEPMIEIIKIEEIDIMTASNDRLSWDIYGESGWITD